MFSATDAIDCLSQMLGNMKFIEHDLLLCFRQMVSQRGQIGIPHVQRHGLNARALFCGDRRPESIQATLLAIFGHIQHSIPFQIVHQRQVFVPFAESLFIHSQLGDFLGLAPC